MKRKVILSALKKISCIQNLISRTSPLTEDTHRDCLHKLTHPTPTPQISTCLPPVVIVIIKVLISGFQKRGGNEFINTQGTGQHFHLHTSL